MKLFIILAIAGVSFYSCVYDPPIKGVHIYIENQTDEFLYVVSDSLKEGDRLICYDTAYVNGKQYIAARGNYIPPFSKYNLFLSELEIKNLADRKVDVQNLYIIPGKNCNVLMDSIIKNNLFRTVDILYNKLSVDSAYYLFIWKDNIKFTTDFDFKNNDN